MAKKKSELEDSLASTLADSINKQFKGQNYKSAFFLDGDDDAPTNVNEWVSTGCSMLDLAISNRPDGGFPVGRITEITGLEASGKSLLAAHTLAETQKKGGLAVYIDTESASSAEKSLIHLASELQNIEEWQQRRITEFEKKGIDMEPEELGNKMKTGDSRGTRLKQNQLQNRSNVFQDLP